MPVLQELKASAWHMEIPFKVSFKHALKERSSSGSVLLKLTLSDGVTGYGEGLPRDYVSGESVSSVLRALQDKLIPDLREQEHRLKTPQDVEDLTRTWLEAPDTSADLAAIGAVETALISALALRAGQNMYAWLGLRARKKYIHYSMVLSCGDERKLIKHILFSRVSGIQALKLKVTADLHETQRALRIIRKYHPRADIRVDANCAWDLPTAQRQLRLLSAHQVSSCEQPMSKDDWEGASQLAAEFPHILICADESLCSYADAQRLIRCKAATSFNIRLTKNGGIFNALRIHRLAQENGIACQLGSLVGETSILSLYGRVFAAVTGDLLFHEGSFGTLLLQEDLCAKPCRFGFRGLGRCSIKGTGLGLVVQETFMQKYARRCLVL